MDGVTTPATSSKDAALEYINDALGDAAVVEKWITDVREKFGPELHPWSLPSLAHAIGAIQAARSHLRAAKHHIESPEPAIDASFEIVK